MSHDTSVDRSLEYAYRSKSVTKVDRYQWGLVDEPGLLMMIAKNNLLVDREYQRNVNEKKALAIASEWSYLAAGVIIVAKRGGRYYVVDGQHRVEAARRRSDIDVLPCIVFETDSAMDEADGFIRANTARKPMDSVDKFRAMLMRGDPEAVLADKLAKQVGRELNRTVGPNSIRCVGVVMKWCKNDPDTLERVWQLIAQICDGSSFHERILESIVYIERNMPDGESLCLARWKNRLLAIGHDRLIAACNSASAFYSKGGAKVWASGVLTVLNKGLQKKLNLNIVP